MGIRTKTVAPPDPPPPSPPPPPPPPSPVVPAGSSEGVPFDIPNDGHGLPLPKPWSWDDVWTYRRAKVGAAGASSIASKNRSTGTRASNAGRPLPGVGDLVQQNWGGGNDLDNAYMFRPLAEAVTEAAANNWHGGLNLTALSMLEQRAYGWCVTYPHRSVPWKRGSGVACSTCAWLRWDLWLSQVLQTNPTLHTP